MLAKIMVAFAFYCLYWFVCFICTGTDKKNLAGLRSYPDAVPDRDDTIRTVMVEKSVVHKNGRVTFLFKNETEIKVGA